MQNIHIVFNESNRSMEISYRIKDEKSDKECFHQITEIARKNKLNFTTGEDDNCLRYFHISSENLLNVIKAHNEIEKLK